MTTLVLFSPQPNQTFRFAPVLDGQVYNAEVVWSLFGRRWYLNLKSLSGALIFELPVIGSPTGINLQSLGWANGYANATFLEPHGYEVLATVPITISGCAPDAYNGRVKALITSRNSMQWPLASNPVSIARNALEWPLSNNPGTASQLGIASFDIDIAGGYFTTSTLVFRQTAQVFEISP